MLNMWSFFKVTHSDRHISLSGITEIKHHPISLSAKHSNRKESPDQATVPGFPPEAAIEDLTMQDIIGLTETKRRYSLNAVLVGDGVLVNTSMTKNINSFEQPTTRIGRLRMGRCGPAPALTIFVAYAPTSSYKEEEVEAFYVDLEKFYREGHASTKS
ncbi:hypothetical protein RB195_025457 [Necator americanus]|uniref:Profilin n=1 Tax=Necator americanus TaxID=51031 RepID=A0ABR1ESD4_NECAM